MEHSRQLREEDRRCAEGETGEGEGGEKDHLAAFSFMPPAGFLTGFMADVWRRASAHRTPSALQR